MIVNFLENNEQFSKAFDAISESDFYNKLTPEIIHMTLCKVR